MGGLSGRLGAEAGVASVEYVGFGVVIAAVIVVLFALDPSLAERLRAPIDDQVCDVLRADCEGEDLPAGERVAAGGGEAAAGDGTGTASGGGGGAADPQDAVAGIACVAEEIGTKTRAFVSGLVVTGGADFGSRVEVHGDGTVDVWLADHLDLAAGKTLKNKKVNVGAEIQGRLGSEYRHRFDGPDRKENLRLAQDYVADRQGSSFWGRVGHWVNVSRYVPGGGDGDGAPEVVGRTDVFAVAGSGSASHGDRGKKASGGGEGALTGDSRVEHDFVAGTVTHHFDYGGSVDGELGNRLLARGQAGYEGDQGFSVVFDAASGEPLEYRQRTRRVDGGAELGPVVPAGEESVTVGGDVALFRETINETVLPLNTQQRRAAFASTFKSVPVPGTGGWMAVRTGGGEALDALLEGAVTTQRVYHGAEGGPDNDWIVLGGEDTRSHKTLVEATFQDPTRATGPLDLEACFR